MSLPGRVAVENGEQPDLLPRALQSRRDGMRHQAAERPAQEVVRPGRLNLADETEIIRRHLLERRWKCLGAGLQSVDRVTRRDLAHQPHIAPAQPSSGMDTE